MISIAGEPSAPGDDLTIGVCHLGAAWSGHIGAGGRGRRGAVNGAARGPAGDAGIAHRRQRPADARFTDEAGVELGWRWTPLEAVGIYVPGGRAAYPSTVLMNAVPASVAGVERVAMVTPPGKLEPAVLAAAKEAGVSEIWRVGGAQACAALAFGAGPIRPVDKIVGPGNAYVTAAKRRLYGIVGIDALAGPSEIVVVADAANDPAWIAADLLSQAEHDPDAQSILITDDDPFALAVEAGADLAIRGCTQRAHERRDRPRKPVAEVQRPVAHGAARAGFVAEDARGVVGRQLRPARRFAQRAALRADRDP